MRVRDSASAELTKQAGRQFSPLRLWTNHYDWFTEGFDAQDMKDATALLAELR